MLRTPLKRGAGLKKYQESKLAASVNALPLLRQPLAEFLARPDVYPVHAIRLALLLGLLQVVEKRGIQLSTGEGFDEQVDAYNAAHPAPIGLREVSAVVERMGIPADVVGWARLTWLNPAMRWEAGRTWPYFAEHLDIAEEALGLRPSTHDMSWGRADYRKHAFEVLGAFPQPPASLLPVLWEMALGSAKIDRAAAQKLLAGVLGKEARIVEAVSAGKAETRAAAADWQGRLGAKEAVPALRAALKKLELERPGLGWYEATRHTFASQWVMSGGSIEKLKEILGHYSVVMTERYAHLKPELFTPADLGTITVDLQPGGEIAKIGS
jgi:hypothetical protein